MVCIGTGKTGKKFGDSFGNSEVGKVCWVYRGPIGKDESDPGGKRAEFYT